MYRVFRLFFLFLLPLLSKPAFAEQLESSKEASQLRLGILNELTGPAAALGDNCQKGMEIALLRHQHLNVQVVLGDVHDDPKTAVSEFQKMLVRDQVHAVVATRSRSAMPVKPLAARAGVALVGVVGHPDLLKDNPFGFRSFSSARQEGALLASLAAKLGKKRLALVTQQDEWASSLSTALREEFSKIGGLVVLEEVVASQDYDLGALATKLKQAKPDLVFANLLAQAALFIRKLREQGFSERVFTTYWIQKEEFVEVAGVEALEGVVFVEVDSEQPLFKKEFSKHFPNETYTPAAYICHVAVEAVLQAADSLKEPPTRQLLGRAIVGLKKLDLTDGPLQVIDREAQFKLKAREIKSGRPVDFSP